MILSVAFFLAVKGGSELKEKAAGAFIQRCETRLKSCPEYFYYRVKILNVIGCAGTPTDIFTTLGKMNKSVLFKDI